MKLSEHLETEVLSFPMRLSVEVAAAELKRKAAGVSGRTGDAAYVYVTDDAGRLVGVLQMRDLLLSPGEKPLEAVMRRDVVSLRQGMTAEQILEIVRKRPYLALPVTDGENRLLGAVNLQHMATAFEKKSGHSLYHAAGIALEELSHRSILRMLALRSPWLILSVLCGLAATFVLGNYFVGIESIISLILFIPIVLGLSGSMARQCAVLVLNEFSRGGAAPLKLARILLKESLLAVFAGGITLVSVGLLALILKKSLYIALALGAAVALAVFSSGFAGMVLPFLFCGVRLDPKFASGPGAVVLCDLFALWVYVQVAYSILSRCFQP